MADRSINLKWPMKRGIKSIFRSNETTFDAVESDLRILLLTNYGERPIHFDFGANLRNLIFEQQGEDLRQAMSDSITLAIEKWMPFLTVVDITVKDETTDANLRPNEVNVKLEYKVGNIDVVRQIEQKIKA